MEGPLVGFMKTWFYILLKLTFSNLTEGECRRMIIGIIIKTKRLYICLLWKCTDDLVVTVHIARLSILTN